MGGKTKSELGISNFYKDIREIRADINRTNEKISEIRETLNNGVKHRSEKNSEQIDEVCKTLDKLDYYIRKEKNINEGKKIVINIIIAAITGIGGSLVTALTILNYLGVL